MKKRFDFLGMELPMGKQHGPRRFGIVERFESHRNAHDLGHRIVVEVFCIAHDLSGGGILQSRYAIGSSRVAGQLFDQGRRRIHDELAFGLEVISHASQKLLYIAPVIQVQKRVERAKHDFKTPF